MSIVDEDYYKNVYKGVPIENDLSVILERASDIVRQNCLYVIDDIEALPSFMQENLKKAVCAQAEFIEVNGGIKEFSAANSTCSSGFSIGGFSMSGSGSGYSSGNISGKISARNSPEMLSYLEAAGLLYRGGSL